MKHVSSCVTLQVKVVAILNDTTGTLVSGSYADPDCTVGLCTVLYCTVLVLCCTELLYCTVL